MVDQANVTIALEAPEAAQDQAKSASQAQNQHRKKFSWSDLAKSGIKALFKYLSGGL